MNISLAGVTFFGGLRKIMVVKASQLWPLPREKSIIILLLFMQFILLGNNFILAQDHWIFLRSSTQVARPVVYCPTSLNCSMPRIIAFKIFFRQKRVVATIARQAITSQSEQEYWLTYKNKWMWLILPINLADFTQFIWRISSSSAWKISWRHYVDETFEFSTDSISSLEYFHRWAAVAKKHRLDRYRLSINCKKNID